jgi:hypothetical protein
MFNVEDVKVPQTIALLVMATESTPQLALALLKHLKKI